MLRTKVTRGDNIESKQGRVMIRVLCFSVVGALCRKNRGLLTKYRMLFHRMNIKSSIFTSGEATNENTTFGVHE